MKRKGRRAKLGLIKPAGVEPETWTMLTAARGGQRGKMVQLLAADPGRVQLEYWYTRPLHFAVPMNVWIRGAMRCSSCAMPLC